MIELEFATEVVREHKGFDARAPAPAFLYKTNRQSTGL